MPDSNQIAVLRGNDPSPDVADLIADYEHGVDELQAAVAGLTADELRARPVPGRWSTLEVVCHVADCEQFFADRMKRTMAMPRPLLLGADGFLYPEPLHYQERDLAEELRLVEITRRQMARILRLAAADAWERTAVHSEAGLVTLRQLVTHAVNHVRHHLLFIDAKRAALRAGEVP